MLRTFACSTPWFVNYQHQWLLSADFMKWFVFRDQSSLNGWRGWVLEVLGGYHILFRGKRRGIKYKFPLLFFCFFETLFNRRPCDVFAPSCKRLQNESALNGSWWFHGDVSRSVVDSAICANTTCFIVNSVAFSFFLTILRTSQQFLLEQESRSTNESWVYAVPKKVDSWPLQASLSRFL